MAEVVSQAAVEARDRGGEALALKTCGLTRRYGQKTVVSDLSLEVQAGDIYGFLGPNGAGKTTTIAKFAGYYARKGWKVSMVCCDSFRADAPPRAGGGTPAAGLCEVCDAGAAHVPRRFNF